MLPMPRGPHPAMASLRLCLGTTRDTSGVSVLGLTGGVGVVSGQVAPELCPELCNSSSTQDVWGIVEVMLSPLPLVLATPAFQVCNQTGLEWASPSFQPCATPPCPVGHLGVAQTSESHLPLKLDSEVPPCHCQICCRGTSVQVCGHFLSTPSDTHLFLRRC